MPELRVVDKDMAMMVVVPAQKAVLVGAFFELPVDPQWISKRHQDPAAITFVNRQSLSGFVARPAFVLWLDPLDCCSCQFWHLQSNHQYHDSMQPDLQ